MSTTLMETVCSLLRERQAALRGMGTLLPYSPVETAWWCADSQALVDYWWMSGHADHTAALATRATIRFRDAAEAVALLNTLAQIDRVAFVGAMRDVWSEQGDRWDPFGRGDPMRPRQIGLEYTVFAPADLHAVRERVIGEEDSSELFVATIVQLMSLGGSIRKAEANPIPVKLKIEVRNESDEDLACILQRLLEAIAAAQAEVISEPSAAVRFRIVEVHLIRRQVVHATTQSLSCLARFSQLGIRVPNLPVIRGLTRSEKERAQIIRDLHVLMPPVKPVRLLPPLEHISLSDEIPEQFIPAVCSAIQASTRPVGSISVGIMRDPDDSDNEGNTEATSATTLWKWVAYALFSKHAQPNLTKVEINFDHLEDPSLSAIDDVLDRHARNPLAGLFNTTFTSRNLEERVSRKEYHNDDADVESIAATRFSVCNPALDSSVDQSEFIADEALDVLVVDQSTVEDKLWWRVLLPGYGEAWVKEEDATRIGAIDGPPRTLEESYLHPLDLNLTQFDHGSVSTSLHVLKMVSHGARGIRSIRIDEHEFYEETHGFDMTEWTATVLRLFGDLKSLAYPWCAEVSRLLIFAEAAEENRCQLRELSLVQTFSPQSSDLLAFLDVLADRKHRLTESLEKLCLSVSIPEEIPVEDFNRAWRRMLRENRTLRSISLYLTARECVDEYDHVVKPLDLSSRLAFLSVLKNPNIVANRLDTSVTSIVFAFAAHMQHREVMVEWYD